MDASSRRSAGEEDLQEDREEPPRRPESSSGRRKLAAQSGPAPLLRQTIRAIVSADDRLLRACAEGEEKNAAAAELRRRRLARCPFGRSAQPARVFSGRPNITLHGRTISPSERDDDRQLSGLRARTGQCRPAGRRPPHARAGTTQPLSSSSFSKRARPTDLAARRRPSPDKQGTTPSPSSSSSSRRGARRFRIAGRKLRRRRLFGAAAAAARRRSAGRKLIRRHRLRSCVEAGAEPNGRSRAAAASFNSNRRRRRRLVKRARSAARPCAAAASLYSTAQFRRRLVVRCPLQPASAASFVVGRRQDLPSRRRRRGRPFGRAPSPDAPQQGTLHIDRRFGAAGHPSYTAAAPTARRATEQANLDLHRSS